MGNEYAYAWNMPLVVGDPLGLQSPMHKPGWLKPGEIGPKPLDQHQYENASPLDAMEVFPPKVEGPPFSDGGNPGDIDPVGELTNEGVSRGIQKAGERFGNVGAKAGKFLGGVVGFVLGGSTINHGSDEPRHWHFWDKCGACGRLCRHFEDCKNDACIRRRIAIDIRNRIRVAYPGFFGRNGLGAAEITITAFPPGWITDDKGCFRFQDKKVVIKLVVNTKELKVSEEVVIGGELQN